MSICRSPASAPTAPRARSRVGVGWDIAEEEHRVVGHVGADAGQTQPTEGAVDLVAELGVGDHVFLVFTGGDRYLVAIVVATVDERGPRRSRQPRGGAPRPRLRERPAGRAGSTRALAVQRRTGCPVVGHRCGSHRLSSSVGGAGSRPAPMLRAAGHPCRLPPGVPPWPCSSVLSNDRVHDNCRRSSRSPTPAHRSAPSGT